MYDHMNNSVYNFLYVASYFVSDALRQKEALADYMNTNLLMKTLTVSTLS